MSDFDRRQLTLRLRVVQTLRRCLERRALLATSRRRWRRQIGPN